MKSTLTLMAILRTATQTKDMVRKQVQLDRVVVQLEIVSEITNILQTLEQRTSGRGVWCVM